MTFEFVKSGNSDLLTKFLSWGRRTADGRLESVVDSSHAGDILLEIEDDPKLRAAGIIWREFNQYDGAQGRPVIVVGPWGPALRPNGGR